MKKISISIQKSLLKNIEDNVEGKNRSDKIRKCIEAGYNILTEEEIFAVVVVKKNGKQQLRMISMDDLKKLIQEEQ